MTGGCASPEVCGRTAVCLLQLEESVHSWGLRACVFREAAVAGQGVVGESHQDQCGASSDAGRWCGQTTSGQPPSHQSHFPKDAMTHGTPSPPGLCYSTGKRANGLAFDISVWGLRGESSSGVWSWTSLYGCESFSFLNLCMPLFCCVFSSPAPPQHLFLKPLHTQTHTRPHTHLSLSVDTSLCLPSCLRTSVSQYVWHSDCV